MIEFFRHILGLCGEHWHPNIWVAFAGSPMMLAAVHYIKCKCGGWFQHKKECKNKEYGGSSTEEDNKRNR